MLKNNFKTPFMGTECSGIPMPKIFINPSDKLLVCVSIVRDNVRFTIGSNELTVDKFGVIDFSDFIEY